jgi:hypothetical protein
MLLISQVLEIAHLLIHLTRCFLPVVRIGGGEMESLIRLLSSPSSFPTLGVFSQ